ncbi:MAG TPA: DUF885 family protein, partial [Paracoccaceae bacterium]|nr:DUF885 family protein [Paracoccaceae bacterium]
MKIPKPFTLICMVFFVLSLSACKPGADTPATSSQTRVDADSPIDDDQRLAAFFAETFDRSVSQNPEFQAMLGLKTGDYGRWSDRSDAFAQMQNQQAAADLERLHSEFDYASLGESSKLSYRVFEYNLERRLRNFEWRFHDYAISQMDDISSDLPTFLQNIHKIETVGDAEDYISRLQGVQTVMQQVVEKLRQGEEL